MRDSFFKELSPEEETQFRGWARRKYNLGAEIKNVWHPVVRDECERMNLEAMGIVHPSQ